MLNVGINGLGRIGMVVLHNNFNNLPEKIRIVAVNDIMDIDDIAYLLKYDSVYGKACFPIRTDEENNLLIIGHNEHKITLYNEKDPGDIPWDAHDIDIVLECTGLFRRRKDAARHMEHGTWNMVSGRYCSAHLQKVPISRLYWE